MEKKQHITTPPCFYPWFQYGSYFLSWLLYMAVTIPLFPRFADSFWAFPVGIIVCGIVTFLIGMRFLWGDIILSADGVKCCRRIRDRVLRWENVIQVAAIRYDATRILVLVQKDGIPMKNGKDRFRFFLRNPRKLVFLPDDKFTRAFVADYYGPEDIREPRNVD